MSTDEIMTLLRDQAAMYYNMYQDAEPGTPKVLYGAKSDALHYLLILIEHPEQAQA